ncbi:MAG TPA: acetoacetate--CoA ligase [Polyangiaceae bacterium]|nr:acetoacetate--CoA ligase [Polyangiaceae bacterium]
MSAIKEGELLFEPSLERVKGSNLYAYLDWLRRQRGLDLSSYDELWAWSVRDVGAFWQSIVDYFGLSLRGSDVQPLRGKMPDAHWFEGSELNYAEHALRRHDQHLAVIFRSESGERQELSYAELYELVGRVRAGLVRLGVGRGDRVAALLPNRPETLATFLAVASLGAIWSSCSPEFGTASVLDRFRQIEPKVLFAVAGYDYGGRHFDRSRELSEVAAALSTLERVVLLGSAGAVTPPGAVLSFQELTAESAELAFEPVPFEHPLWVLYSSGTTGLPKPIVQGHGGILLEHVKALALHCDLKQDDRFFWFSTTGWMMWNFLISGLLLGTTIVLYDGSPAYPGLSALWKLAEQEGITYFGTSAPYLLACQKAGVQPSRGHDLSCIRSIGTTGAPLPADGFGWVYEHVHRDLLLASCSGGTDVCTAFVLGCPLLPVHAGELQCRGLGAKVEAFDEAGQSLIDEVGELVLTEPLPSMPIFFWGDLDGSRLRQSYYATYEGVWRHGDWIKITARGSCVIYGRSDSTLNRGGVRMGTSEFYRVVEELDEVADSLVVDTASLERADDRLWLFVVLSPGLALDDTLRRKIKERIRRELSPRHVPDEMRAVAEIPRTLNGKKLEVPIKKLLQGTPLEKAASRDTLANPASLDAFVALASELVAAKRKA